VPYDPLEVFANVPSGTVGSPGGTTAPAQGTVEAWTVTVAAAFAVTSTGTRQFHAADQNLPGEIFTVTVCPGGTGSQSWPQVIRGAEGTTPVAHSAGFTVTQVVTAGDLAALQFDPWQFPIEAYGGNGDGKIITDATMTSGSNLLSSPAQAQFTTADIGKSVLVSCAGGGAYSPLGSTTGAACTITSINSVTQAVLSVSSASATSGASICGYGTDNSAALNNTVAAAVAYAQANNAYAEVVFSNCIYALGGTYSPVNYKSALGNSLIPLPIISSAAQKILLVFTGQTKTIDQALPHWYQLVPQAASSILMCLRTDGTNDGTYGPSSVIGGPFDGYGGELGLYTNMMPSIDGLQVVLPYNSTYGGFDFFGCAEAVVVNSSSMPLGVVNYGSTSSPPFPNISTYGNISNQWTSGLKMPCTGNNARCDVYSFSCYGLCYGMMPSEHSAVVWTRVGYCLIGVMAYSGNGVSMPHAGRIWRALGQTCNYMLGCLDGAVNLDADAVDIESGYLVTDTSSRLHGTMGMRILGGSPGYISSTLPYYSTQPAYLKLVCLDNISLYGLQASGAPAAPATTVPQQNAYFVDATVYVTSTAAITAAKVSTQAAPGTMTAITGLTTAGAGTVAIPVPAGLWFSVTSSGTITTQWFLAGSS
jgi:hypothetical protein